MPLGLWGHDVNDFDEAIEDDDVQNNMVWILLHLVELLQIQMTSLWG